MDFLWTWVMIPMGKLFSYFWRTEPAPVRDDVEHVIRVEEINKRTIGREIIRLCGNEGSADERNVAYLRRLLQGCITILEKYSANQTWSNAQLRVFDYEGKEYVFQSGMGKNRFVALYDDKDEVIIRKKH